ncbi:MAG: sodium-dependent transporter [Proteobacteria bacterium]|nr:sodium-dependent transporter [Pseudomonadota bacterium]
MSDGGGVRAGFATRFGFIMAAAGSAVGLGNIWKFPYITGEYGGGAFVLVYLACILLVGLPLMYAELILGRRGGKSVLGSLRALIKDSGEVGEDVATFTGLMAVASGFLILAFYSVVAGWAIHYFFISLGLITAGATGEETFGAMFANDWVEFAWHTCFMIMTITVVARGIEGGIERIVKRLMPILVGILVLLLIYVCFTGGVGASLEFLFKPDFSKLSADAFMEALGHSFFTLSLGMGAMVTYGSYVKDDTAIVRDGVIIAILDTFIALLAGVVIFAVVFAGDAEPAKSVGLVFMSLPDLFVTMPGGQFVSAAFFLLLIFAAWSSAISLLEVVVAWLVDEKGLARPVATWVTGGLIWLLGIVCLHTPAVFDFLDNLTTKFLLPLGGLLIAIAVGWLVAKDDREAGFKALGDKGDLLALGWTWVVRIVTPVLVLAVILSGFEIFPWQQ